MTYEPTKFTVRIDGKDVAADDLESQLRGIGTSSVLLDTTTLGLAEILLCTKAFRSNGTSRLSLLYVEPAGYAGARKTHVMHRRDFDLSDEAEGYLGIPGFAVSLHDRIARKIVFFLGYEGQRLDRAFEQFENLIRASDCTAVFGVPAFRPGWEMDAFANNVRVLADKRIGGGVDFCGAENPAAAVEILRDLYKTLRPGERFFVAPIGTKPHGIGAALFACEYENIGVLYDHPHRKAKRSQGVGTWHLFEVDFLGVTDEF